MKPVSSGYSRVNDIDLYHENYGQREPPVPDPWRAYNDRRDAGMGVAAGDARQVIAVEMQGHGRTSECVSATGPADAQEWVTSVADLHFYSSFWMNLHHQLHADARDKNRVDASGWSSDDRAARSRALEVQP